MSLRIEWTETALQSLSAVFDYTYQNSGERQLRKLHTQIQQTAYRVSTFPQSGAVESFSKLVGAEYRGIMVIREIKLIYRIIPDGISIEYVKNSRLDENTLLETLNIQL